MLQWIQVFFQRKRKRASLCTVAAASEQVREAVVDKFARLSVYIYISISM